MDFHPSPSSSAAIQRIAGHGRDSATFLDSSRNNSFQREQSPLRSAVDSVTFIAEHFRREEDDQQVINPPNPLMGEPINNGVKFFFPPPGDRGLEICVRGAWSHFSDHVHRRLFPGLCADHFPGAHHLWSDTGTRQIRQRAIQAGILNEREMNHLDTNNQRRQQQPADHAGHPVVINIYNSHPSMSSIHSTIFIFVRSGTQSENGRHFPMLIVVLCATSSLMKWSNTHHTPYNNQTMQRMQNAVNCCTLFTIHSAHNFICLLPFKIPCKSAPSTSLHMPYCRLLLFFPLLAGCSIWPLSIIFQQEHNTSLFFIHIQSIHSLCVCIFVVYFQRFVWERRIKERDMYACLMIIEKNKFSMDIGWSVRNRWSASVITKIRVSVLYFISLRFSIVYSILCLWTVWQNNRGYCQPARGHFD